MPCAEKNDILPSQVNHLSVSATFLTDKNTKENKIRRKSVDSSFVPKPTAGRRSSFDAANILLASLFTGGEGNPLGFGDSKTRRNSFEKTPPSLLPFSKAKPLICDGDAKVFDVDEDLEESIEEGLEEDINWDTNGNYNNNNNQSDNNNGNDSNDFDSHLNNNIIVANDDNTDNDYSKTSDFSKMKSIIEIEITQSTEETNPSSLEASSIAASASTSTLSPKPKQKRKSKKNEKEKFKTYKRTQLQFHEKVQQFLEQAHCPEHRKIALENIALSCPYTFVTSSAYYNLRSSLRVSAASHCEVNALTDQSFSSLVSLTSTSSTPKRKRKSSLFKLKAKFGKPAMPYLKQKLEAPINVDVAITYSKNENTCNTTTEQSESDRISLSSEQSLISLPYMVSGDSTFSVPESISTLSSSSASSSMSAKERKSLRRNTVAGKATTNTKNKKAGPFTAPAPRRKSESHKKYSQDKVMSDIFSQRDDGSVGELQDGLSSLFTGRRVSAVSNASTTSSTGSTSGNLKNVTFSPDDSVFYTLIKHRRGGPFPTTGKLHEEDERRKIKNELQEYKFEEMFVHPDSYQYINFHLHFAKQEKKRRQEIYLRENGSDGFGLAS
eukprot:Awhi_evm1s14140